MDFLQKIGGRKFIMALIAVGVATFIELKTTNGLSTTMAGFLGSIVAAFSVANYAVTKKHMDSKTGGSGDGDVSKKLDQLLRANDPENLSALANLLEQIGTGVNQLQESNRQIGTSVINIGKAVQSR